MPPSLLNASTHPRLLTYVRPYMHACTYSSPLKKINTKTCICVYLVVALLVTRPSLYFSAYRAGACHLGRAQQCTDTAGSAMTRTHILVCTPYLYSCAHLICTRVHTISILVCTPYLSSCAHRILRPKSPNIVACMFCDTSYQCHNAWLNHIAACALTDHRCADGGQAGSAAAAGPAAPSP